MLVIQRVIPAASRLPGLDEMLLAEHSQLVRHGRFALANDRGKIAHAQLATSQGTEDAEACWVCQDGVQRRRPGHNIRTRHGVAGGTDGVHMNDPFLAAVLGEHIELVDLSGT